MLLSDTIAESYAAPKLSVFGTDVDEEALDVARSGCYPARAALDMDARWRAHYTRDQRNEVRVSEKLRRECIFSRHELLRDRPMVRMDLLVCRGVFGGVPRSRRGELAERLHCALRAGGSLLALDHVDSYPEGLFERVSAGHWVARAASRATRKSWTLEDIGGFIPTLGQPLLLCDAGLRLIYASADVARAWGLASCRGRSLDAIASQLPGGGEIASAARRVLLGKHARDIVVRDGGRMFTARVCAASGARGVSVLFNEVTTSGQTAAHAILERGESAASEMVEQGEVPQRPGKEPSESLDEALFQALPVAVSIHDMSGALRATNPRLAALGAGGLASGDEQAPEPDALVRRLYQEKMPSWLASVLTTGKPMFNLELSLTHAGLRHYWLCNLAPIRCGRGELRGAVVAVQEISALKRAEADLREADRQKEDFLALLGHELRNPITAIWNATELLGRLEPPTPQLLRLRSIFDRQTAQTAKLIDGLLDVSRVARGKFELQRVPLELVELVRQAVGDRSKQFEGRFLRLLLPEGQLWVEADRVRLTQILDNLTSNALKFTRPQGCISIGLTRLAGRACLRVEDDGDGIDAELLPHIFERFRQGRSTRSQGLGLGLALVKGLCDLHGFALTAHSDGVGRGAAFHVEFPLTNAPESSPPESRVDGRSLDLLLVEDNQDVAETLAELLRAEGHRVEVVESGERGLQLLNERRPDAVLSDIGLPGMDGLTFARRIRNDPDLSKIRLVALTGFGGAATESRVMAAGFERCLSKPVGLEALRKCLARVAVR